MRQEISTTLYNTTVFILYVSYEIKVKEKKPQRDRQPLIF